MNELPGREHWLTPVWQPHPRVCALVTTRHGHYSPPPWQGFNLGTNCGDDPQRVTTARAHVQQQIASPQPPYWLNQVHGTRSVVYGDADRCADGVWTDQAEQPCVVLTADCLPVLLARTDGTAVGAFHAGWRGLLTGMLEVGIRQLAGNGEPLSTWLGPAICQHCYQVGDEVRTAFVRHDEAAAAGFSEDSVGHWRMDLFALARQRLQAAGVADINTDGLCTSCQLEHFYSYRREGQTGRFATMIWLKD